LAHEVTLEGTGLHTGVWARVTLRESEGPVRLVGHGWAARVDELEVVSTARATTVRARAGGQPIGTVEHLFAAFAGMGVYDGIDVFLEGPEMPLLDGGAMRWCEAIAALSPPRRGPRLRVERASTIDAGPSRYEFSPGGEGVQVEAVLELGDPRIARVASWRGDADDFVGRIAPARTFALASEVEELLRRGLARHVDPASVVLISPETVHFAGRSFTPEEPARHKLLDLMGDLYLKGGPPLGKLVAVRPGHASNARAVSRAMAEGVLRPE
jgi:UDP-3-O-[3-hydroxymyristoyl] N-acetylglucosamine deacetylase